MGSHSVTCHPAEVAFPPRGVNNLRRNHCSDSITSTRCGFVIGFRLVYNNVSPRWRRDDMPRRRQIATDLRPSQDRSAVRTSLWPAVAKLQADSMPIAQAAASWNRQTDGSRYSKNAPLGRGYNKSTTNRRNNGV